MQVLSTPNPDPIHASAALEFIRSRLSLWLQSGLFDLAAHGLHLAHRHQSSMHDPVRMEAETLRAVALDVDDILAGASTYGDEHDCAVRLSELMCAASVPVLIQTLGSQRFLYATAETRIDVIYVALRRMLATGPEEVVVELLRTIADRAPRGFAMMLKTLGDADSLGAIRAILRHAHPALRRAMLDIVARRDTPWPVELSQQVLADPDPSARRIAVMRLVRDGGLSRAAETLAAASRSDAFHVDVALWLAEVLRPSRRHPDVRTAWRTWTWSRRRWAAMLGIGLRRSDEGGSPTGRRAA